MRQIRGRDLFGGLDALTIHDRRARGGLTPQAHAFPLPQHGEDLLPPALQPPDPPVVVDRLLGRQVVQEQLPRTPRPQPVRQRVDDLPPLMQSRSSRPASPAGSAARPAPTSVGLVSGIPGRQAVAATVVSEAAPTSCGRATPLGLFRHPLARSYTLVS